MMFLIIPTVALSFFVVFTCLKKTTGFLLFGKRIADFDAVKLQKALNAVILSL